MLGVKSSESAARYCGCHDELHNFLRCRSRGRQLISARGAGNTCERRRFPPYPRNRLRRLALGENNSSRQASKRQNPAASWFQTEPAVSDGAFAAAQSPFSGGFCYPLSSAPVRSPRSGPRRPPHHAKPGCCAVMRAMDSLLVLNWRWSPWVSAGENKTRIPVFWRCPDAPPAPRRPPLQGWYSPDA